ncbi:MAG: NAD(P)/FAD-dependent oxidoreductase [Candidatus Onthomonas sp.]
MIDLAIIGAGPAGLAAAIYAARAGLNFAVLEQDGVGGGQITATHEIENYPGVGALSGEALGDAFRAQAEQLGAEIRFAVIEGIEILQNGFRLLLEDDAPVESRTVIAATGAVPKELGIPGEAEFASYCAVCDGAFSAGKDVLVVGGGDTAVEDALYLSSLCRKVTVALRRDLFRAAPSRVALLAEKPNVEVRYHTNLKEIWGDTGIQSILLEQNGVTQEVPMQGVFIAVGVQPVSGWLNSLPLTFSEGYVVADETCKTDVPGLFAAGDLRKKPLRQVVTAVADGANAVASAVDYLQYISSVRKGFL